MDKELRRIRRPESARRSNYMPVKFTPRQNPFYCALPYNDKARTAIDRKRRASFPGFKEATGPRCFYLQRSMDRHSQRQPYGLCAMGRRRPVPHRSLAIRVRQRTTETQLEQGRRSRCFTCCARLPRIKGNGCDRLEVCRFQGSAAWPWSTHGENNTFVINDRKKGKALAEKLPPKMFAH